MASGHINVQFSIFLNIGITVKAKETNLRIVIIKPKFLNCVPTSEVVGKFVYILRGTGFG